MSGSYEHLCGQPEIELLALFTATGPKSESPLPDETARHVRRHHLYPISLLRWLENY